MLRDEMIKNYKPMLAKSGKPFNSVDYIYEIKWDGIRSIMIIFSKDVYLVSRNGNILNNRYPELIFDIKIMEQSPIILDGEIVYLENGKPNFQRLLARDRLRNHELINKQSIETPVTYMVFDILKIGNHDLMNLPLYKRKIILESTIKKIDSPKIKLTEYISETGIELYNAAKQMKLEGVMAKGKNSKYFPGKRSDSWQKIKCINSDEFLICGYLPGLRSGLGSLVLGQYDSNNEIIYRGQVGTGFTDKEAEILKEYLDKIKIGLPVIKKIDLRGKINWVKPIIVATVEYLEFTNDGILRHPSFKGIRSDIEKST